MSSPIKRVIPLRVPSSAKFTISIVNCFQHSISEIRKFQHKLTVKIIVYIFIEFNVLFYKGSMGNVENSLVRACKHVTFTPWYGQSVLGNTIHVMGLTN